MTARQKGAKRGWRTRRLRKTLNGKKQANLSHVLTDVQGSGKVWKVNVVVEPVVLIINLLQKGLSRKDVEIVAAHLLDLPRFK